MFHHIKYNEQYMPYPLLTRPVPQTYHEQFILFHLGFSFIFDMFDVNMFEQISEMRTSKRKVTRQLFPVGLESPRALKHE